MSRQYTCTYLITTLLQGRGPLTRSELYRLLKLYGKGREISQSVRHLLNHKVIRVKHSVNTGEPKFWINARSDTRERVVQERKRVTRRHPAAIVIERRAA